MWKKQLWLLHIMPLEIQHLWILSRFFKTTVTFNLFFSLKFLSHRRVFQTPELNLSSTPQAALNCPIRSCALSLPSILHKAPVTHPPAPLLLTTKVSASLLLFSLFSQYLCLYLPPLPSSLWVSALLSEFVLACTPGWFATPYPVIRV